MISSSRPPQTHDHRTRLKQLFSRLNWLGSNPSVPNPLLSRSSHRRSSKSPSPLPSTSNQQHHHHHHHYHHSQHQTKSSNGAVQNGYPVAHRNPRASSSDALVRHSTRATHVPRTRTNVDHYRSEHVIQPYNNNYQQSVNNLLITRLLSASNEHVATHEAYRLLNAACHQPQPARTANARPQPTTVSSGHRCNQRRQPIWWTTLVLVFNFNCILKIFIRINSRGEEPEAHF